MKKSLYSLKIKALLLWLFLAGFSFCLFPKKSSLDEKENMLMEGLLQSMVFEQCFGYTLFGNKPVSLAHYPLNPSFDTVFFSKRGSFFPIVEAWSILEKNILCRLKGNYILLKQVDYKKPLIFQIIIVNKCSFLRTVSEHLDLFCELLEKKMSPKELLDEVILNQRNLWDILNNKEVLYGIILGYGKENALAFTRKRELAQVFNSDFQKIRKLPPFYPKPSKGFESVEEEYRFFEDQHCFFDIQQSPLSPLNPPCFMTMKNNDKETKLFAKEYKETFKNIIEVYAKGDFLSITLDRLITEKNTLH